jgi:hypothetical protein
MEPWIQTPVYRKKERWISWCNFFVSWIVWYFGKTDTVLFLLEW